MVEEKGFNWCTFSKICAIVFGGYVILNYLASFRLEAVSLWELKGYIDGLVRASGNAATAVDNLDYWRNYWTERAPGMEFIIDPLYNYGLERAAELYGGLTLSNGEVIEYLV